MKNMLGTVNPSNRHR